MQFFSVIVFLAVILSMWQTAPWLFLLFALIVVGVCVYIYVDMENGRKRADEARRQTAARSKVLQDEAAKRIEHHGKTLARKANQTIYKDDYGNYVFDKWFSERDYFIDNVLLKESPLLFPYVDREWLESAVTERALAINSEETSAPLSLPNGLSPTEFEHFCANLLRSAGWEARVTTATGDQGIDIVGKFSGVKVVFQCKLYSTPVGNAAVQEVIAGRQYEGADFAAVISNATFTTAARQLAAVAGVHLLHFSEVQNFASALLPASYEATP